MAVYFPRGQQNFRTIQDKLSADSEGVASNSAVGMAFVTNQELTLAQRDALAASINAEVDIFHLERVAHILDRPDMASVRRQFLGIDDYKLARISPALARDLKFDTRSALFVGREPEVDALVRFLHAAPSSNNVALIVGMAGSGKTALAQSAARRAYALDRFAHQIYIDFNGYSSDEASVVQVQSAQAGILLALGQREISEDPAMVDLLYHKILAGADRDNTPILLLLDNVSSVEQVRRVVVPGPNHRCIITSRNLLVGDFGDVLRIRVGALPDVESAELIRRQLASAGREVVANELPDLAVLAIKCGFLPLALRIAASILSADPGLPVNVLAQELADEAERLETLEFDDLNVRAAFGRSYRRLGVEAATCFRFFSLHPGQEPTTASLSKLLNRSEAATKRLLRALLFAHLVDHGSAGSRWKMHDLMRLYSGEKSLEVDPGETRSSARVRLIEHYVDQIDHASEWVNSTPNGGGEGGNLFRQRRDALAWFDEEIDNVIACIGLAQSENRHEQAWQLGINAAAYPPMIYRHGESIAVSMAALSSAQSLRDSEKEASALNNVGLALSGARDFDGAIRAFKRGIRYYRESRDATGEARLLVGLGSAIRERGDAEASIGPLRRAVKLTIEGRCTQGAGFNFTNLGISLREAGRLDEAVRVLDVALDIHRRTGARRAEASTLCHLGTALHQLRRYAEAIPYLKESIVAGDEVGDTNGTAAAVMNLGNAYRVVGNGEEAMHLYERACETFRDNDDHIRTAMALVNMATLSDSMGNSDAARRQMLLAGQLDPKWRGSEPWERLMR